MTKTEQTASTTSPTSPANPTRRSNPIGWVVSLLSTAVVVALLFVGHQFANAYHYYHLESVLIESLENDFKPEQIFDNHNFKGLFERDNIISRQSILFYKMLKTGEYEQVELQLKKQSSLTFPYRLEILEALASSENLLAQKHVLSAIKEIALPKLSPVAKKIYQTWLKEGQS